MSDDLAFDGSRPIGFYLNCADRSLEMTLATEWPETNREEPVTFGPV